MAVYRRLLKELKEMRESSQKEISENISFGPIDDENLLEWDATILGPTGTPYFGGIFKLLINIPSNYPIIPPVITFKTRLFHPNISETGEICLDILKYHWSPVFTISKILISIVSLFSDPNPHDPLNSDAAHLLLSDKEKYNEVVVAYVRKYAN